MKKIFMSIIAVAAMAMAVTSCNKDEVVNASDIYGTFEDSEAMNLIKTHFVNQEQFWDEHDRVIVMDRNGNCAYYNGTVMPNGNINLAFDYARSGYNENYAPLTAVFPAINPLLNHIWISGAQHGEVGVLKNVPIWGTGTLENFKFYNACGFMAFDITGDGITIDSVSITTEKYINGHFKITLVNDENISLSYQAQNYAVRAHGSKTNTVYFDNPIQTSSTPQKVFIYLPGGTYNVFNITFYSNGKKYVKYNNNPFTIGREDWKTLPVALSTDDFKDCAKGTISAKYNVAPQGETAQYVVFAQGNIEFIGEKQYWRFADNQWDFRGRYHSKSAYDRDLFSWGANGYHVGGHAQSGYGNGIMIWGNNSGNYANYYYTGTSLASTNDWGSNRYSNAENRLNSGWRTLTAAEMTNILANHNPRKVTLTFIGKTGIIIFPEGVTPCENGENLDKTAWNYYDSKGCVFFVADSYRMGNSIDNTQSCYWLNTAASETTASALIITTTGWSIDNAANKQNGGYVRLVKAAPAATAELL